MGKLSDIGTIKQILAKHGFSFSKALGQNFLINPTVSPKMAELCGAGEENTGVLEIGPGIGVLTCELVKRANKVVTVELDRRLIPVLNETLSGFDNVKIINDDIMKVDLKKLLMNEFSGMNVVVCANLPYYITSPVLMRLLEEKLGLSAITVMVQKEVAQRLCAGAENRKTGSISLAVNYYAEPKFLFNVKKESFMPEPKVDSAVVRLNVRENPPCKVLSEELFFKVIKMAFLQRRKTVINALASGGALKVSKPELAEIFERLEILPTKRAENLSIKQFADLANELYIRGFK